MCDPLIADKFCKLPSTVQLASKPASATDLQGYVRGCARDISPRLEPTPYHFTTNSDLVARGKAISSSALWPCQLRQYFSTAASGLTTCPTQAESGSSGRSRRALRVAHYTIGFQLLQAEVNELSRCGLLHGPWTVTSGNTTPSDLTVIRPAGSSTTGSLYHEAKSASPKRLSLVPALLSPRTPAGGSAFFNIECLRSMNRQEQCMAALR